MIRTNPDGTPIVGQKVVDPHRRVMTVMAYADRPTISMVDEHGNRIGCCVGSPLYNDLEPYEEPAGAGRVEPPETHRRHAWHWVDLGMETIPARWTGHNWIVNGETWTPEEVWRKLWRYDSPAERGSPTPLRTVRHVIGDISTEETIYNDWTDAELLAAWRKVCQDTAGDLPPSKTMLLFVRRVLRGEKAS